MRYVNTIATTILLLVSSVRSLSITKVDIKDWRTKEDEQLHSLETPVVIANSVPEADRKQWWNHIQTRSRQEIVQVSTNDDEEGSLLSCELQEALELLSRQQQTAVHISSVGSSCSTDQLPDFRKRIVSKRKDDKDLLSLFSMYTPIHDTLTLSCGGARSTLCCRAFTSVILHLAGKPNDASHVEWKFAKQQQQHDETLKDVNVSAYKAVTRTWSGAEFSMGWTSPQNIFAENANDDSNDFSMTTTSPGDILLIPPFWWFQNRAGMLPNVLVHSKHCGMNERNALIRHMVSNEKTYNSIIENGGTSEDVIIRLFECIEEDAL